MGASNMLKTIMNTAHDLLLNTVFYLMGITVLTGALSKLFSEFGVVAILEKLLKPFNVDAKIERYFFDTREEAKEFAEKNNYDILTYEYFAREARLFAKAILEVIEEGDADGTPFAFPKINFHINEESFTDPDTKALLMKACLASSKSGCPYFIFDRNACSVSQCCRLKIDFTAEDMKQIETPEELRFVGGQNVSINLPNVVLKVGKDEKKVYDEIAYRMDLACRAHISRRDYLLRVASRETTPLRFYNSGMDGKPYIRTDRISWLLGIVGLNECVYNLIGEELHESDEAYLKGLEIISFMNKQTKELEKTRFFLKLNY